MICFRADDLGFKHHEQTELGILVHVLYSNPRVLYAPNNTQADAVIKKVNQQNKVTARIRA